MVHGGASAIELWNVHTGERKSVETGMKDLTFCKWSAVGPQLAVGTGKGNLLLYNKVC